MKRMASGSGNIYPQADPVKKWRMRIIQPVLEAAIDSAVRPAIEYRHDQEGDLDPGRS
jgi:hypothetical protein